MEKQKIMISYNWGSQNFAKSLCAKLVEAGYNVWMDIQTGPNEGMKVDIISGMTDGLSKAAMLLVILSPAYEASHNCQTELRTAYMRKLPLLFLKHPSHKVSDETLTIMNTSLYYAYDVDPADGVTKIKDMDGFLDEMSHRFPPGSSARAPLQKRILLVGASGVGKSSIAALLINGKVEDGLNKNEIYVSNSSTSATLDAKEFCTESFSITDTIGTGFEDASNNPLGTPNAIENLKNFLIHSRTGYHYIILVVTPSRAVLPNVQAYKMFYQGLFPDMKSRFFIIVTHWENTVPEAQMSNDLGRFFPGISTKLFVNIPVSSDPIFKNVIVTEQAKSRKIIIDYLDRLEDLPLKVPAVSLVERSRFYEIVKAIMNMLGIKWDDEMERVFKKVSSDDAGGQSTLLLS